MRTRNLRAVVVTLFLASLPAVSQEARTRKQRKADEVAEREARVRKNEQRLLREYGTADLSDVNRRGIEHRIREMETERTRMALGGLADPSWTFLGPTVRTHRLSEVAADDSGLVASIALHPTNPQVILVGTAGAGVWRTADGGSSWKLVTDGVGVLQVGAVAFSPSDPNIAYAGTACADASTWVLGNGRSPGYPLRLGVGLLSSSDGGVTWRVVTPNASDGPANYFWQILVDPSSPTTLLVAGDKGVQRSTDGGLTFTAVLASETAPYATGFSRAGSVIYASTWGPNLPGSVYKSEDGGVIWTEKANGLPGPAEERSRCSVAAAPGDPNRVYVLCNGSGAQLDGARSNDGGDTWTPMNLAGKEVDILSSQGNFCNVLSVSPKSPDIVHAGGTDHFVSGDGGASWTMTSDWLGTRRAYLHADQHAHAWTADGSTLYIGNDGGLFSTSEGTAFKSLNRGLEAFLVNGVCHDPRNLDRIAFGAQDNGNTIRVSGTEYRETTTGDGFACSFHPTDDQIIHMSTQNQSIYRSTDGGATWSRSVKGLTDAGGSNATFGTLIFRSSTEPDRLFTASKKKIWTSADNGSSWVQLSDNMPHIDSIADFWVSPKNPGIMALVDLKGRVVTSNDGGVNWVHKGDVATANLNRVRIDSANPTRIFVSSAAAQRERQRLFLSTDDGATFTPVSNTGVEGGLPDVPVRTLEQDLASPNVWWCGTFIGLYRSADNGLTWARYGSGLPNVPVQSIALTADGSRLRVGTQGRGVWEVSGNAAIAPNSVGAGPSTLSVPSGSFTVTPSAPRPGRRVQLLDASTGAPSHWSWDFGDGGTSNEQFPYHVFTAPGRYNVSLTVSNASGTAPAVVKPVTVAYPDTGTGEALTYLFPVVLTASGAGGTQFSTELTLTNRSAKNLTLTFRVKGATLESNAQYELKPGQEVYADVFSFLRQRGMFVPEGTVVASMRIEVRGADNIGQFGSQVRVTTPPNADQRAQGINGRFGLSFPAAPLGTGASKEAVVYGLQQTSDPGQAGTRSNLACVNAGGGFSGSPNLSLEVAYRDGDTGKEHASRDTFTLSSFQFEQKTTPLAPRGMKNAVATIRRTAGTDQFVCYGVLNDNLNGDGSFVPMVVTDPGSAATESIIPVIVGTATFKSELTIANRTKQNLLGQFGVVPVGENEPIFGNFDLAAGHQVILSDVVAELKAAGFPLSDSAVASMFFQFEPATTAEGDLELPELVPTSQVYVGVRTYAQRAGGLFGLAYGYSPVGTAADTEAYVYGLQQTGTKGQEGGTRANLALVHAYGDNEEPLRLEVTYFGPDGTELGKEPGCAPCTLGPGEFRQFNSPLERFNVPNGYAWIRKLSGSDQFFAYGVLNDQANDDGSYVPMSIP